MSEQDKPSEISDEHKDAHLAFWKGLVNLAEVFMAESSLGLECVFDELLDLTTKAALDIGLTEEQFLESCKEGFEGIQQEIVEKAQKN
jgi:hypothetical protein